MYIAQQKLLPLHLRDESQKASESAAQPAEAAVEPSPPSALDGKTPYIGYLNDYLRKLRFAAACLIERRGFLRLPSTRDIARPGTCYRPFPSSALLTPLQAASLANHRWKDQLKVEMRDNNSWLKLSYWR